MKISTKGRYALRVMVDLALNDNGQYISLNDIAKRQGISNKYLEQIIAMLNKKGYLLAARGISGGYKLAKEPKMYKVGDILRATEGSLKPIYCLEEDKSCDRRDICKTHDFWQGLDDVINNYVDSKTLEDLIK